ncbi:MAG: hypothetical protein C0501_29160 [Isosphaera sp.]|nr:hypothetical protein [Isosphaera sp.]
MSTVPRPARPAAPRDEKVYHPLDRVRGTIRRYVLIEGVLSVLLFLVAWFALALVLDFGVFKAFGWDWVRDGAFGLRVAALAAAVALLGGILVFRIVRRLTKEFSYPALALVLERRFPRLLGDRLITAVELADVEGAAKFGYSADMIRRTIDEARERVGRADVSEAFNWKRLTVMGLVLAGSVLGLLVGAVAAHAVAGRGLDPKRAFYDIVHNSAILAERNLLLMNTPWRKRALLELRDARTTPDGKDLGPLGENNIRIARDGPAPRVKVRAYRWVVADRSVPDGWRPLRWKDVTPALVGVPVPDGGLDPDRTADSVLEDAAARTLLQENLGQSRYDEFRRVFDRLEEVAADPANGRRLRKLDAPKAVTFKYVGLQSAGDGELKPEGNSDFAGDVTGLKEDVLFTVRAEDYRTPQRGIHRIPPPTLTGLTKVEYQPAYLHYASPLVPADPNDPNSPLVVGGYPLLRDLRQRMKDEALPTTGGRTVFSVRAGTEVVLTGVTEQPLAAAYAVPKVGRVPGAKPGSAERVPVKVGELKERDGDREVTRGTFEVAFRGPDRVTAAVEFDLVMRNADTVEAAWGFAVGVSEDAPPVVELASDVIRKVGKDYWVTPKAKIPFLRESNVRDDAGLSRVAFVVTSEPAEAITVRNQRAALAAGLGAVLGGPAHRSPPDLGGTKQEATFPLGQFHLPRDQGGLDANLPRETLARVRSLLGRPLDAARPPLVTKVELATTLTFTSDYKWEVGGDYFDVGKLLRAPADGGRPQPLAVAAGDIQPRYELSLVLEATDTNYDTGPRTGRHPAVPVLVVSPGDLLVEIGRDEEKLGAKLDDALKRLAAARAKYAFVRSKADLQLPDEVDAVKVRSRDALQDVAKARDIVQSVGREYRRIERECVFNQLDEKTIVQHGKLANRLDRVQGDPVRPVSRDEADQVRQEEELLREQKRERPSFPEAEKRMAGAQAELDDGRWPPPGVVAAAANELDRLEQELVEIRRTLGEAQSKEKLRNMARELLSKQEQIKLAIEEAARVMRLEFGKDTPKLFAVGPQFLAKGETRKVKHGINWRQYKEDTLVVSLVASDPKAVVVPEKITLDFEKNNLDFEYEVRAGTAPGDYKVTLKPAAGDPIEVLITVK